MVRTHEVVQPFPSPALPLQVLRTLRLLDATHIPLAAAALAADVREAAQRTSTLQHRRVPNVQAAADLLRRLLAGCWLLEELGSGIHAAAGQLGAQLAHSFFMPLSLTCLAVLARLHVRMDW